MSDMWNPGPALSRLLFPTLALCCLFLTRCVHSGTEQCSWGALCPPGLTCDAKHEECVKPEQLVACLGEEDGTQCQFLGSAGDTYTCDEEVCIVRVVCGDEVRQSGEQCDGRDVGGANCWSAAQHLLGELGCTDECTFDTSDCHTCGNGVVEPAEACEPGDLQGESCVTMGYVGGVLGCSEECRLDLSGCFSEALCPSGTREPGEACDGDDLAGESCESQGFVGGDLGCTGECELDTRACTRPLAYFPEDFEEVARAAWDWRATGDWAIGAPTGVGPPTCWEGIHCAGTVLDGPYSASRAYDSCALVSPPVSLVGVSEPVLSFYQWMHTEDGLDGGNVQVSIDDGVTWSLVTPEGGYDGSVAGEQAFCGDKEALGWHRRHVDLADFADQTIQVRFAFASNPSYQFSGWYIDSVLISEQADLPVVITSAVSLGNAFNGMPFSQALSAVGGTGSYRWSIVGGTNHEWLSIGQSTGVLSGTPAPANAGLVNITIRAEVSTYPSNYDEESFTLDVY